MLSGLILFDFLKNFWYNFYSKEKERRMYYEETYCRSNADS